MEIMNRFLLSLGAVALLVSGLVYYFVNKPGQDISSGKTSIRHVSYSLVFANAGPDVIPKAELWVNGPNRQTGVQACDAIKADHSFQTLTDDHNNQILHFRFENLPPYGQKIINIEATLSMKGSPPAIPLADSRQYLEKEQYVEISDERMIRQAQQLAADSETKTVENIFRFVEKSISRTTYSADEKGALYSLLRKKGDCTEFMHLVLALCRVNAIPARAVSGYIVSGDQRLSPDALHDWAEVYLKGRWRVIDPFFSAFMDHEERYLVMQIHANRLQPQPFQRWRTNYPNLQVSMVQ